MLRGLLANVLFSYIDRVSNEMSGTRFQNVSVLLADIRKWERKMRLQEYFFKDEDDTNVLDSTDMRTSCDCFLDL